MVRFDSTNMLWTLRRLEGLRFGLFLMNDETSMSTDSLLLARSVVDGAPPPLLSLCGEAVRGLEGGRGRGRVDNRDERRSPAPIECERFRMFPPVEYLHTGRQRKGVYIIITITVATLYRHNYSGETNQRSTIAI